MIQIVIGALGKVPKNWKKRLEELKFWRRIEIIQTTALLRSAKILRRVLETWGDSSEIQLATSGVNNNNNYNYNNNNYNNIHGQHQPVYKKLKKLETDTNSINTKPAYWNGIWHGKCTMLIRKSGKIQVMDEIKHLEKRKLTCTWEYWKRIPLNKCTVPPPLKDTRNHS